VPSEALPIWRQRGSEEVARRAQQVLDFVARKTADDRTRPVFHFRPPAQWMNDVCGAFFDVRP
jgi:sucrose-6-phosphate hydrolase SacC (GH32 family)